MLVEAHQLPKPPVLIPYLHIINILREHLEHVTLYQVIAMLHPQVTIKFVNLFSEEDSVVMDSQLLILQLIFVNIMTVSLILGKPLQTHRQIYTNMLKSKSLIRVEICFG